MSSIDVRRALEHWRGWQTRSVDELAAVATVFVWSLGLDPQPETTATDQISRRTIRYYVSNGLMSRPEGPTRSALYHYRHLIELLFIKARQHQGCRLEEIQEEMAGATASALEKRVTEVLPRSMPPPAPADRSEFARPEQRQPALQRWAFLTGRAGRWRATAEPSVFSLARAVDEQPVTFEEAGQSRGERRLDDQPRHRVHIPVDDEIEIVVPGSHPLAYDDEGRGQVIRAMRRLIRGYLSGSAG
jgi:DNA-binding transcriptional MerR regulator